MPVLAAVAPTYVCTASGVSMTEQLSSPLSTGGAGVIFEYRIAAIMLSRMLRGAHIPIGIQLPLSRVAFQQHNSGHPFDDIVAYAEPPGSAPRIQIQVKRSIRVTGGHGEFIKVMAAALEVCRTQAEEVRNGDLLMGLAAGAHKRPGGERETPREPGRIRGRVRRGRWPRRPRAPHPACRSRRRGPWRR